MPDVIYAVFDHDKPVDAAAKGKSAPFGVVYARSFHHIGVYHAAAEHLEPLSLELHVYFNRGFGKREIAGTETQLDIIAE